MIIIVPKTLKMTTVYSELEKEILLISQKLSGVEKIYLLKKLKENLAVFSLKKKPKDKQTKNSNVRQITNTFTI